MFVKEIEFVVKALSEKETPHWNDLTGELYHTFKEEIIASIYKVFQKS